MGDTTVIHGARLIDGTGADPRDDMTIVIDGERIAAVGPSGSRANAADRVIDAAGRTLMPALSDCHVHLCFDGETPDLAAAAEALTPVTAREACIESVRAHLAAGITTVRDLGGVYGATIDVGRAVAAGDVTGARVIATGGLLTAPGGHAHFIGHEIDSVDAMVKKVGELHDEGATCIKIVVTGGFLTPGIGAVHSAFPPEQIEACVTEAHARGLRVAAHAIGAEGIEAAVAAGVDSIEHGCFLTPTARAGMIANPTWLVPTLSAPERISNGGPGVPDYARAKSEEVQRGHLVSFREAVADGVRIATGTDAGTPYNFQGGLAYEFRLMHQAGMPLTELAVAATRASAQLLGVADDRGTIEPGKRGDVILLDGDPLVEVLAYERVTTVVMDGRVVRDD